MRGQQRPCWLLRVGEVTSQWRWCVCGLQGQTQTSEGKTGRFSFFFITGLQQVRHLTTVLWLQTGAARLTVRIVYKIKAHLERINCAAFRAPQENMITAASSGLLSTLQKWRLKKKNKKNSFSLKLCSANPSWTKPCGSALWVHIYAEFCMSLWIFGYSLHHRCQTSGFEGRCPKCLPTNLPLMLLIVFFCFFIG